MKAHRDFANKNCPHRTNMSDLRRTRLFEAELNKSNISENTSNASNNSTYTVKVTTDTLNAEDEPRDFL